MKNVKLLFVCHGNICRSPMAEFVMKKLVKERNLDEKIFIASAATTTDEIGNPVYPPAKSKLAEHGISCDGKRARQITKDDYPEFDLMLGMDSANIRDMKRRWNNDPGNKVHYLMEYTDRPGDVADPWYTRDFEATWQDVLEGCTGLLDYLTKA
jgi:protein-tyrosine phosphatase